MAYRFAMSFVPAVVGLVGLLQYSGFIHHNTLE